MKNNIENKVIVITGASSGLGKAAAELLSKEGAKVVVGERRKDKLNDLVEAIQSKGGAALAVEYDFKDPEQAKRLINSTVENFGRIDVLINSAGMMQQSLLIDAKFAEWDNMIDINIKGTLYCIAAVLPIMKEKKSGQIINVASISGHKTGIGDSVYSGTKFAIRAISEALRQEVKEYNLRTTIVSPGAVESELSSHITAAGFSENIAEFYRNVAIPATSFADVVAFAINQPESVDINEVIFRPTVQQL